jgi:hypothetical protein
VNRGRHTGKRPQSEKWWSGYTAHLNLRNRVVHAGERVSAEQARASLMVAREFMLFIARAWTDAATKHRRIAVHDDDPILRELRGDN